MREIAAEAGVATGAAYYYFDSKEAIVLAFYNQAQKEMEPLLEEALTSARDLKQRIQALLEIKLKYFEPNRRLLGALSSHADPEHPLSPFGPQTTSMRERDMKLFDRALSGQRTRITADLRPHLPRVLWLYQMGIILFWIYDHSAAQKRTRALLDKGVFIIARLIKLSAFPLLTPVRRMVVDLVETMTP